MAQNLVVQLLLKTGAFSDDLKTARGQIQNFQKGCSTAGKAVSGFGQSLGINIGTLSKFGGVVGIAVAAGKEFKNILESSQTTADALEGAIAGCKGAVESFHTALATRDFSLLSGGLWAAYDAAKAVQAALDQLGNTQIAYDYKSAKNQTKFQEAYTMYKSPESTPEMKEEAKKNMKEAVDAQFTYASNYSSALYKTYVAQVIEKAGSKNLKALDVTPKLFEKAMDIDLGLLGDPETMREDYKSKYGKYLSALKEYTKKGKDNNITAQEQLKRDNAEVIAINAMLQLMKDEKLKGIGQLLGAIEQAKLVAISMEKTMGRAIKGEFSTSSKGSTGGKSSTKTTTSTTTTSPVIDEVEKVQVEEKLAELYKEFDSIKNRLGVPETNNILQKMNDWEGSWEGFVNSLTDEEKLLFNQFADVMKKRFDLLKEISLYETTNSILQGRKTPKTSYSTSTNDDETEPLPGSYAYMKKDLNSKIDVVRKALTEGVNLSAEDIKAKIAELKSLEQELSDLEVKFGFKAAPEVIKPDMWDEFNRAMANTSTIVSNLGTAFNTLAEESSSSLEQVSASMALMTKTTSTNAAAVAASILQMVSTTLPAISALIGSVSVLAGVEATEKAVSTSKHWIEAIAAVVAIAGTVAGAIASAKKLGNMKFANGGIVPGDSYTGDRVVASVNSGEMILNKRQQNTLFRAINSGSLVGSGMSNEVQFKISGTDLVGVLNNNTRKQGLIR